MAQMGLAVLRAKQANRCAAPASTWLDQGANVVTDVALTQSQAKGSATSAAATNASTLTAASAGDTTSGPGIDWFSGDGWDGGSLASTNPNNPAISNAPVISGFPGSYGPGKQGRSANANGCVSAPPPPSTPAPAKVQMPVMLPAVKSPSTPPISQPKPLAPPAVPPAAPNIQVPPQWKNLCWALRNSWVNQSQFDPTEYNQLDYACSQLGYTGTCPDPSVAGYLIQGAIAGTLPKIQVTSADIAGLQPAPNMTGVTCGQSLKMGLAGFAPAWSSAFGGSCPQSMAAAKSSPGGAPLLFWAGLIAAGFGMYELLKRGA